MLDGELIVDIDKGVRKLRFYVFDCIMLMNQSLVHRPLSKRLGALDASVLEPYYKLIAKDQNYVRRHPFKF